MNQITKVEAEVDPNNDAEWLSWVDMIGQRYSAGDFVAVGALSYKSPKMVVGVVERINRKTSKGELLGRSWKEWVGPNGPSSDAPKSERLAFSEYQRNHPELYELKHNPQCTVTVKVLKSSGYNEVGKNSTFKNTKNIVKITPTEELFEQARSVDPK